jgi:hypothetical protein
MGSSRRIEKCPQSGWGCIGGGATDHHLEDHLNPVQLYSLTNLNFQFRFRMVLVPKTIQLNVIPCTASPRTKMGRRQ